MARISFISRKYQKQKEAEARHWVAVKCVRDVTKMAVNLTIAELHVSTKAALYSTESQGEIFRGNVNTGRRGSTFSKHADLILPELGTCIFCSGQTFI